MECMSELLEYTNKFPLSANQSEGEKTAKKSSAAVAAPTVAAASGPGKRPSSIRRKGAPPAPAAKK